MFPLKGSDIGAKLKLTKTVEIQAKQEKPALLHQPRLPFVWKFVPRRTFTRGKEESPLVMASRATHIQIISIVIATHTHTQTHTQVGAHINTNTLTYTHTYTHPHTR